MPFRADIGSDRLNGSAPAGPSTSDLRRHGRRGRPAHPYRGRRIRPAHPYRGRRVRPAHAIAAAAGEDLAAARHEPLSSVAATRNYGGASRSTVAADSAAGDLAATVPDSRGDLSVAAITTRAAPGHLSTTARLPLTWTGVRALAAGIRRGAGLSDRRGLTVDDLAGGRCLRGDAGMHLRLLDHGYLDRAACEGMAGRRHVADARRGTVRMRDWTGARIRLGRWTGLGRLSRDVRA